MTDAIARTEALGVTFGAVRVLDGVTLDVPPASFTALVGPNGAGKTTLLRTLAGLTRVADGDLALPPPGSTGYCPQNPGCAWNFSLEELCSISPRPSEALAWCTRLGAGGLAGRRLGSLSGGERRMAHLALALSIPAEPYGALILLDEPTADLDAARRLLVIEAIRQLSASGAAVVAATHDFGLARAASKVAVLAEGRLVAHGPPEQALNAEVIRATWGVELAPS